MGQRPELILKLTENLPWTEESDEEPEEEYLIMGEWFGSEFEMTVTAGWNEVVDVDYLVELTKRFEDYKPQLRLGFS